MKALTDDFKAHLLNGATTLCHCWRVLRKDGVTLGFTDHDQDLTVKGYLYKAQTGFDASEAETQLGFVVGSSEVTGALVSDLLCEQDLRAGLYDGASVEIWLVNWASPDQYILLDVTGIGQVTCIDQLFKAELRSLAYRLNEDVGRLYQTTCNANLGDTRCGVDVNNPAYELAGTVFATDGGSSLTVPPGNFVSGYFNYGMVTFQSGANRAATSSIKSHTVDHVGSHVTLWTPLPSPIAIGDRVLLQAGCDKQQSTCRAKFSNLLNFRGFALMPDNDVVTSYVNTNAVMDGGSLFQ